MAGSRANEADYSIEASLIYERAIKNCCTQAQIFQPASNVVDERSILWTIVKARMQDSWREQSPGIVERIKPHNKVPESSVVPEAIKQEITTLAEKNFASQIEAIRAEAKIESLKAKEPKKVDTKKPHKRIGSGSSIKEADAPHAKQQKSR